jgi:hypothetical protein
MKFHYPSYMGVEVGCFKVRICLCQCLCEVHLANVENQFFSHN